MYCEGKRWRDVRREGFMMSVLMVMTAVDWSLSRHDNGYSPSQTVPVTTLTDLTLPRFHLIHNGIQASTRPPEHGNESSSVLTKTLPPTLPTRGSTRKPLARHVTTRRGGDRHSDRRQCPSRRRPNPHANQPNPCRCVWNATRHRARRRFRHFATAPSMPNDSVFFS